MSVDPIRRRFGHGPRRLRVGIPATAARLSALARTQIRHERRLTLVPFGTIALIVWLLATIPPIEPRMAAEPAPIEIVLAPWTPPLARTRTPEPPREAKRARPNRADPQPAPPGAAGPAPVAMPSQDLASAPRTPAAAEPAPIDLDALVPRAPRFASADPLSAASPAASSAAPRARPHARGEASAAATDLRALAHAASAGNRDRRAHLEALEHEGALAPAGRTGGVDRERRPQVSAARPEQSLLSGLSGDGALDGWQEVPLEELPDCDPPGRQDLLKKRILVAVPGRRECSHPGGSYRFVEARSLGAFLMWSRPSPSQVAGQPRDRDACDVLDRALACLGVR